MSVTTSGIDAVAVELVTKGVDDALFWQLQVLTRPPVPEHVKAEHHGWRRINASRNAGGEV
jgi:hypothetical protein